MIKQHYNVYLNTTMSGIIQAGESVIQEINGITTTVGFRYTPEYLHSEAAIPLCPRQLPLKNSDFILQCAKGYRPGFIDDYLPDDWGRKILSRLAYQQSQKQLSTSSCIDMLSYLNSSRTGALLLIPQDNPKAHQPVYGLGMPLDHLARIEAASQQVNQDVLSDISYDEMSMIYLANSGTGVGGARPKALVYDNNGAYLAKFNTTRDPYNAARVESACLSMAVAAGIDVPESTILTRVNQRDAVLIKRFDINNDSAKSRNHLITFNALLKDPVTQMDEPLPFTYNQVFSVLQKHSVAIEHDARQLLALMLFNRCINNTDDHPRNFSLLHSEDGYRLAPAYDLMPSLVMGNYHAAGFDYSPNPPTLLEIQKHKKPFGLPKGDVTEIAERVSTAIGQWTHFAKEAGLTNDEEKLLASVFHSDLNTARNTVSQTPSM